MNTVLVVGIVLTGVALLLAIISTAIPFWYRETTHHFLFTEIEKTTNVGLFQACGTNSLSDKTTCSSYDDVANWFRATQAMMVLSILALVASVGLSAMYGFVKKDKPILALGAGFMSLAGGVLALLGVIIFGAKMSADAVGTAAAYEGTGTLHAGFGLAVVAVVFALVASFMVFRSKGSNV